MQGVSAHVHGSSWRNMMERNGFDLRYRVVTLGVVEWQKDRMAQSIERRPHEREIGNSVFCRVKLMSYKIDTRQLLGWHSVIALSYGYCFAQCQDNMTAWDNSSWCWLYDFKWGTIIN